MATTFNNLGVNEFLVKALENLDIKQSYAYSRKSDSIVLSQKEDVVALAKTGTGKTAAFGLPLLQLIDVDNTEIQAVILAPTRELGQQIFTNLNALASHSPNISIASICGGVPIKSQIERLKENTHIIVATPGRLADLVERDAINIKKHCIFYFR